MLSTHEEVVQYVQGCTPTVRARVVGYHFGCLAGACTTSFALTGFGYSVSTPEVIGELGLVTNAFKPIIVNVVVLKHCKVEKQMLAITSQAILTTLLQNRFK